MTANDPIEDLREIRSIMEKSSRFMSLSGMSGVMAGIYGLVGAWASHHLYQNLQEDYGSNWPPFTDNPGYYKGFALIAMLVLGLSILTGIILTARRAKRKEQTLWDKIAKRMIFNLCVPLIAGGAFCLSLLIEGLPELVYAGMLIFYGLALVNGSKYTLADIRFLGILDIGLGIAAAFKPEYGPVLWIIGFGILHIVYGIYMYLKYERN